MSQVTDEVRHWGNSELTRQVVKPNASLEAVTAARCACAIYTALAQAVDEKIGWTQDPKAVAALLEKAGEILTEAGLPRQDTADTPTVIAGAASS